MKTWVSSGAEIPVPQTLVYCYIKADYLSSQLNFHFLKRSYIWKRLGSLLSVLDILRANIKGVKCKDKLIGWHIFSSFLITTQNFCDSNITYEVWMLYAKCGKEARKEMKIFLAKILYPESGTLCSVVLEVLIPKRRMLLPENTTVILLNWIKTAIHLVTHRPSEFTCKERSYCIGWVNDLHYQGEVGLPLHNRGKEDYGWNRRDTL